MRIRLGAALLVAVLLALPACGKSKGGDAKETGDKLTTTTSAPAGAVSPAPAGTPAPGGAAGGAVTTARPAGGGGGTPGAAAGEQRKGPAHVAPGTYRYRQSGSASTGVESKPPPEGTLTVDAPQPGGNQEFHRVVDPNGSRSDATLSFRPEGMFLVSAHEFNSGLNVTCTFNPPMPSPPWPPTVGQTFSGHGECGELTVDIQGRISSARKVPVEGRPVDVFVLDATVTTTGQVDSLGTEHVWFAPEFRLPVHTESRREGTFSGGIPFKSELVSDLVSGRPS